MTLTQHLERLTDVLDYFSQASVYTFLGGQELDQSFALTSGTIAVPNARYGYDPIGTNPAPLQLPRHTAWKVFHLYTAGETWTSLKRAMMLAFGHNRKVLMQKALPDGTLLIAEARLATFPDNPDIDSQFRVTFTITFEQFEDWREKETANLRWDSGFHWDTGLLWDQRGLLFPCSGATTNFMLTNNGNVNEQGVFVQLNGPMNGTLVLANTSCDVRAVPLTVAAQVMRIDISLTLGWGEWIAIDGRTGAVASNAAALAGNAPWSVVRKWPGQRRYFEVVPGNNTCQLIKADATQVVSGVAITNQGAYTTAPTGVTFSGGGAGVQATGTVQTSGVSPNIHVTGVLLTGVGSGYTSAPTIGFTGGVGTAATATAVMSQGSISVVMPGGRHR